MRTFEFLSVNTGMIYHLTLRGFFGCKAKVIEMVFNGCNFPGLMTVYYHVQFNIKMIINSVILGKAENSLNLSGHFSEIHKMHTNFLALTTSLYAVSVEIF